MTGSRRRTSALFQLASWVRHAVAIGLLLSVGTSSVWGQEPTWYPLEKALTVADTSGRSILVHVYAPWCGWCHKMRTEVYSSEGVQECLANHFVLTRLNRDDKETIHSYQGRRRTSYQLATTLRADAVPTVVLLTSDGHYLLHLSGFVEPAPLEEVLAFVATGAYLDTSFEAFRTKEVSRCELPLKENE